MVAMFILILSQSLVYMSLYSSDYIQMLLKWTEDEDQELARIIRMHGTGDWALIRKQFKSNRSRDSVIKRWHGKLKFNKPLVQANQKSKKIVNERKRQQVIKRTRRNRKTNGPVTRRDHQTKANVPQNTRNRFQRLRNMIEGQKNSRDKRAEEREIVYQDSSSSDSNQDSDNDEKDFAWGKSQDDRLLMLVLQEGVMSWEKLGVALGCSQGQARSRWQQSIYNNIKQDDKVGGFHKYSAEQDSILSIGHRNGLNWSEIMVFLPRRTEFSIEARWRRLVRPELQVELSKNKHYIYREFLKKIVEKKRLERHPIDEAPNNDQQQQLPKAV